MALTSSNYSCNLRGKFDFANNTNTGKWSTSQEVYRLNTLRMSNVSNVEADYGFNVIETKSKVRGNGKALVLRWESSAGKDFELLGWGLPFEATTRE